jgi:hypothetical protein
MDVVGAPGNEVWAAFVRAQRNGGRALAHETLEESSKLCVPYVHHGSLSHIACRPIRGVVPDVIHHIQYRNVQRAIPRVATLL